MKPCLCIQKCVSMMVFLEVLGFKHLAQHRFLNLTYTRALLQGLGCSLPHHGVRTPWGARLRGVASAVPWTGDFCFWVSSSLCRKWYKQGTRQSSGEQMRTPGTCLYIEQVLIKTRCCHFRYKSHEKRDTAMFLDVFLLTVFGREQALNILNELMSEWMRQIT